MQYPCNRTNGSLDFPVTTPLSLRTFTERIPKEKARYRNTKTALVRRFCVFYVLIAPMVLFQGFNVLKLKQAAQPRETITLFNSLIRSARLVR